MTKTLLILVPVVLLIGLGTVFLMDSDDPNQGVPQLQDGPTDTIPGKTPQPDGVRLSGERKLDTAEFVPDDSDDGEEFAAPEDGDSHVYVVGPDGQPVPNATIRLLRWNADEDEERGGGFGRWMPDATPPHVYREVQTDRDGLAVLSPLPRRRFEVVARTDEMYGSTEFVQGQRPGDEAVAVEAQALIRMGPIKRVRVQLITDGGGPLANVRIEAQPVGRGNNFWGGRAGRGRGDRGSNSADAWTADPNGEALIEITSDHGALYRADQVQVQANLPGLARVSATATVTEGGEDLVTLRAPRTTTVDVELRGPDGALFEAGVGLNWIIDPTSLETEGETDGRAGMRTMFERSITGTRWVRGGRARIGGIAPGAKVTFTTRPRGRVVKQTEVQLDRLNVEQAAVVQVGATQPYLTLLLADADGEPAINTTFRVDLNFDDEREPAQTEDRAERMTRFLTRGAAGSNPNRRTDAEGKMRIPARPAAAGELFIFATGGRRGWGPPGGGGNDAEQPLAAKRFEPLEAGESRDLGQIALDAGATLLTGRVINSEGTGIAGARVTMTGSPPEGANPNEREGRGRRRGGRGTRYSATSDSQGKFRILGRGDPALDFSVEATGGEYRGDALRVAIGQRDVEITLQKTGGLSGSVILVEGFSRRDLSLSLQREGAGNDGRNNRRTVRLSRDSTFEIERLTAGMWTLTANIGTSEAGKISGIEVLPGQMHADPRLQEWLLGQDFFKAEVRVADGAGNPIARARVNFTSVDTQPNAGDAGRGGRGGRGGRRGGGNWRGSVRTNAEGIASRMLRHGDRINLTVTANGFASKTIEDARFPQTVTMLKGTKLAVRFDPPMPAFRDTTEFRLTLTTAEAESRGGARVGGAGMRGGNGQVKAGEAEVTLNNVAPGTYTLRMFFRGPRPAEGGRPSFGTLSLGEISVLEGSLTQEVTLTVTPAMLEGALQAIGG